MSKGRSIRLFLADGTPGGIITAEIMNWTGHVIMAPRSRLPDLLKRPEAARTGVYFLTGADPSGAATPVLYVGETDNVGKRLAQHAKDETKDFWDRACIVTSKDHNLTKAHARYLESRLISIAGTGGRVRLANGTAPDPALLPEADIADMEFFIEQLRVVLPVLGLDFLREATPTIPMTGAEGTAATSTPSPAPAATAEFELFSRKHDLRASAREVAGEFIVLAGSQAQAKWIGMEDHSYSTLHRQLVETGILVPSGSGPLRFAQDYVFASPSAASAVVVGRADNGRRSWRLKGTDVAYHDWQKQQVAAVTLDGGDE